MHTVLEAYNRCHDEAKITNSYNTKIEILTKTFFTRIFHLFSGDITTNISIKGKLVTYEGVQYMEIASAQVNATFEKYHVRVDKLFKNKDTSK